MELVRKWTAFASQKNFYIFHLHFERFPTSSAWGNKKGRERRSRREVARLICRDENELYRQSGLGYSSGQHSRSLKVNSSDRQQAKT